MGPNDSCKSSPRYVFGKTHRLDVRHRTASSVLGIPNKPAVCVYAWQQMAVLGVERHRLIREPYSVPVSHVTPLWIELPKKIPSMLSDVALCADENEISGAYLGLY